MSLLESQGERKGNGAAIGISRKPGQQLSPEVETNE